MALYSPPPPPKRVLEGGEGRSGTQKFGYQKWPNMIFPVSFSPTMVTLVRGGGFQGGAPPPPPHNHSNTPPPLLTPHNHSNTPPPSSQPF